MKFKVGDKVRLTRDGLSKQAEHSFIKSSEISGWEIKQIIGDKIYCPNNEYWYEEKYLELVPEEPEFEYGEEIEVQARGQDEWFKAIFICKIPGKYRSPYVCVEEGKKDNFKNGELYEIVKRDFARKLRPQLTRKEIADKFGVSEDFTLVD